MAICGTFGSLVMLFMISCTSASCKNSGFKESSTGLHTVKRSSEMLASTSLNKTICSSEWSDLDKWVPSKEVKEAFPVETVGVDYENNPVRIFQYGKWNVRTWVEAHGAKGIKDYQKFAKYEIHRFIQLGMTKGRDEGAVIIFDWDGFSLSHYASVQATKLSLEQFGQLTKLFCGLNYGFMVNTNFAADAFLSLAKPFLGNFLDKLEIYGTQRDKWVPKILRRIPKNQLPRSYGGDNEDIGGKISL